MITLDALAAATRGRLRAGSGTGDVAGVWPAGAARPGGWTGILAVVEESARPGTPQAWAALADTLTAGGAAGVAAADPPPELLDAADRHGLPVLDAAGRSAAHYAEAYQGLAIRRLRALLDSSAGLGPGASSAEAVLRWLGEAVQGRACLLAPYQQPPPFPGLEGQLEAQLEEFWGAALRTISTTVPASGGMLSVRVLPLGAAPPHALVVARPADLAWTPAVADAVALVSRQLTAWLVMRRRTDAPFSASLLQMLMARLVLAARRTARPLGIARDVLRSDRSGTPAREEEVRVYVIKGRSSRRVGLIAAVRHRLPRDLVTGCPVDDGQIIIVAALGDERGEALRALVAAHRGMAVGASRPVSLEDVAGGHAQATRALATAQGLAERYAEYRQDVELVRLLDAADAYRWAAGLLDPIADQITAAGLGQRTELADTLLMWLAYGASGTAEIIGRHRNTISNRVTAAAERLRLDLGRLPDRIALDLALRVVTTTDPPPGPLAAGAEPPGPGFGTLRELLGTPAVTAWAEDKVRALAEEPALLRVVVAWIGAEQDQQAAAEQLGMHRKTVARHLRAAGALVQAPLIPADDGGARSDRANGIDAAHDLVLALHLTGRLPAPLW